MNRDKQIIKVSIYGIITNLILVGFKAAVGFIANSIAIILDAVNNLSDALSSIITIIGTKLASRKPDKEHPFGYGRVEYFSSVIIAVIVLVAGLTFFKESVMKIITPEKADYSMISLIVIIVAVFVKFFFGKWVKAQGKLLNSGSLIASGTDAISDSFLSLATFIGAIISYFWGISLEGYLGVIISIFILKASWEILQDTVKDMIGARADTELTNSIKKDILKYREVQGVYDLTIHNYGPNKVMSTAHIQISDSMTAKQIHILTKQIQMGIYAHYGIALTIGIYAANDTGIGKKMYPEITKICKEYKNIIQIHGFYVDEDTHNVSFDVIFDFEEKEPQKIINEIHKKVTALYPQYTFSIIIDTDFSD